MEGLRLAAALGGALLVASPAAADVRVTIGNGHVSISAANATIRQILGEWARVGQTRIVNLDRVAGPPTTIEIADASEVVALEILLRSVGGYILAPRQSDMPNASRFDRILILPASSVAAPGVGRPPSVGASPPTFPQPQLLPPPRRLDDDEGDGPERGVAPGGAPPQGPPNANPFPRPAMRLEGRPQNAPQDSMPSPPAPATPSYSPTAPGGVPVPGMVAPVPQAPPGSTQPR